ncbi:MAG: DUF2330 domain-containing protein [Myxococcales bacterium]|nr:DUF2330 domain-containing protein [Polyangiaceae bacterium]MDW8248372.1 DUF2330 domain-containing protein [Myxococcales bacterium]
MKRKIAVGLAACLVTLLSGQAGAFCGFYVGGADAELFNHATQVVLMREGTRTVLSMANNYQGPPSDFAMVVPVPVILQKENVKTLSLGLFRKIDQLTAPRLVEYWEQDPCHLPPPMAYSLPGMTMTSPPSATPRGGSLGVKIEAQFEVGEYEVVILSAQDSMGLDTWLRREKYNIPRGAEPVLKPYVQAGMKFFVAKVNIAKVKKDGDRTMLSPLRFHYDSEKFELPVRLGLLNSSGTQDLIVHILARGKRYEVANYRNVTIPTNLDVKEDTREKFGAFYTALFDQTVSRNPGAAITEYAWDASTCDPCPGPALDPSDLTTLGADVIDANPGPGPRAPAPPGMGPPPIAMPPGWFWGGGFVITRIHLRYGKNTLGEDLVFRAAEPIVGGREVFVESSKVEKGARRDGINNFQARYAIRHPWTGPIPCREPRRGIWGGPPPTVQEVAQGPRAATDLAFAPRGVVQLSSLVREPIPELNIVPGGKDPPLSPELRGHRGPSEHKGGGCAGCSVGTSTGTSFAGGGLLALLGGLLGRRRLLGKCPQD